MSLRLLHIDKNALRLNLNEIRARAGGADIVADLSGDGQGVGLLRMARFLQEEGLCSFAVTETQDAVNLRRSGFSEERILMLRSITDPVQLRDLMDCGVTFTLGSYEAGIALNGLAGERRTVAEARVRIDSGLGQYGFLPTETDKMLTLYRHMPGIAITGLYTRFSATNILSETQKQYDDFMAAAQALQAQGVNTGILQALDSAALFRGEFGEQNAVCVGSALIGRVPVKAGSGLTKVGLLEAPLEELNWLDKGARIGTGKGVTLKKPTRVAVLDVGWFNGIGTYRPSDRVEPALMGKLKSGRAKKAAFAPVFRVNGKKARVLGQIGMTSLVLDVTRCNASPGDSALLEVDPRYIRGIPVNLTE